MRRFFHGILTVAGLLVALACGGGGGGGGSTTPPPPPAPSIQSFVSNPSSVTTGAAAQLTAVFSNGTGSIDQGIGPVTSGVAVSTGALNATKTFTLTVTGTGTPATAQVTVTVNAPTPGFYATGSMTTPRAAHTVTLLGNGKVLAVGGSNGTSTLATAELYDPATGTWTRTAGDLLTPRYWHTATLLDNGEVLIVGGAHTVGGGATNVIEKFNPATGTFRNAGFLPSGQSRGLHTANKLLDGKVLIAGGKDGTTVFQQAWLYDPVSETCSTAGTAPVATFYHCAITVPDGRVIFLGGEANFATNAAYLWTPGAQFSTAADGGPTRGGGTAALSNGNAVFLGGYSSLSTNFVSLPLTGTVFFPASTQLALTPGGLATGRAFPSCAAYGSGKVLVVGGVGLSLAAHNTAEIFDTATGTFSAAATTMNAARAICSVVTLPNGRILVTGGSPAIGSTTALATCETYLP